MARMGIRHRDQEDTENRVLSWSWLHGSLGSRVDAWTSAPILWTKWTTPRPTMREVRPSFDVRKGVERVARRVGFVTGMGRSATKHSPVDIQSRSRDESVHFAGEERNSSRDVRRRTRAAQWNARDSRCRGFQRGMRLME